MAADMRVLIDDMAELLVVPSFTRIGFDLRQRLYGWKCADSHAMQGRVVAITGATSGLGEVAAEALATMGAGVRLLARDRAKADAARDRIERATGNHDVASYIVDMSDQMAVRQTVARMLAEEPRLDVLINNAGALLSAREESVDGIERARGAHIEQHGNLHPEKSSHCGSGSSPD